MLVAAVWQNMGARERLRKTHILRKMDTLGFEPRPSACEADVIPLHHVPICFHGAVEHGAILTWPLECNLDLWRTLPQCCCALV